MQRRNDLMNRLEEKADDVSDQFLFFVPHKRVSLPLTPSLPHTLSLLFFPFLSST